MNIESIKELMDYGVTFACAGAMFWLVVFILNKIVPMMQEITLTLKELKTFLETKFDEMERRDY